MKVDLRNHVALVTGAGRHIGRAIGDLYAENGATVVYTDIRFDDPTDAHRRQVLMDVADEQQVGAVVAQTAAEFGRLDVVVNNAGVICPPDKRATIDQFSRELWDRIIDVDLTAVYLVGQAAARVMAQQGAGRIINIASVAGLVPLRLQCAYNAAKAGVVNLTRAMAVELGSRGVRVNSIAPGSISTEATRALFYGNDGTLSDKARRMLDHVPLGAPGTVEDIAHAALFLAARESAYITGHCLTVDGGWTAGYLRDF